MGADSVFPDAKEAFTEWLAVLRALEAHLRYEAQQNGIGVSLGHDAPQSPSDEDLGKARSQPTPLAPEGKSPQSPAPTQMNLWNQDATLEALMNKARALLSASKSPASKPSLDSSPSPLPPIVPLEGPRRLAILEETARKVSECTRCRLHETRTHTVFARGSPEAKLVFVGEGPGQHEDQQGKPFVGPAGQLLDKMIKAMGQSPDTVYICNVVKCRPPKNRTPLPDEVDACAEYLERQLEALAPLVIVALGQCAARRLGCDTKGTWRGIWGNYRGIPVMPTYHPAFLLRNPEMKRPVWEDLQKVMRKLEELSKEGKA
ncbi:MAG: uracil-DNA glycosylase [Deltaproteobacteria bacterium]|nr:uracil-DNA glycosylase [Deltaproteobacteria bacterium]